jgi:organic hydroperoxide reductase OsmC/OhrA
MIDLLLQETLAVSNHQAQIYWQRGDANFLDGRYSRRHELRFASTVVAVGSASSAVVPAAYCELEAIDPEAAFVASLAGCHMLWFLSLAAAAGYVVDEYRDDAEGLLARNSSGELAMTAITLRPAVSFASHGAPDRSTYLRLHENAHQSCFIARSVRSDIVLAPTYTVTSMTE